MAVSLCIKMLTSLSEHAIPAVVPAVVSISRKLLVVGCEVIATSLQLGVV